jgi:acetyltransferase-like isoleucine patch superfamily enzyme
MALIARIVRSVHNRTRIGAMRVRGAATRVLRPGALRAGDGLLLGRNVDLVIYGELVIGTGVVLADGCALEVGPRGRLVLGDRVFIGRHSVLSAHESVVLGDDTLVAEHCTIRDQDHHVDPALRAEETRAVTAPVTLEANVWVGAGARILRGSHVGAGSVIAANSVVRDKIPAGVVAGGIPAKVLRSATAASRSE